MKRHKASTLRLAAMALTVGLLLAACSAAGPGVPGVRFASEASAEPTSLDPLMATGAASEFEMPGVELDYDGTLASSIAVVVTKRRPLDPIDYVPDNLVELTDVPHDGTQRMRAQAAEALTRMWNDAREAGASFRVVSAYRTFDEQAAEHAGYVAQYGAAVADRGSARAGYSEHQTGLAADVNDVPEHLFTSAFGSSAAGTWLEAHAHEYGFIISYPRDKEAVTGYRWEPWHVRFVGTDISMRMHDQGVTTLQEFMGMEASPTYG